MFRSMCPKKVKSAERVLEVLRYFNADRQEATVMDIAREMGYPQSSTSELLRCLVQLGYLHRDRYARTYRPTARVALLGAWVQPKLFRRGHLLPMLDRLAEETGQTVFLASKVGLTIQYIHVVAPRDAGPATLAEGTTTYLLHSAPGKALLSTQDQEQTRKLIHRLNAETEDPVLRISFPAFVAELDHIRARGYAAGVGEPGSAVVSILLPRTRANAATDERLVMGIHGPAEQIAENEEQLVGAMRGAIARHLRPVRVPAAIAPAPQPELARAI
jgi:DNA-binding IclR family transcriptional regulator